MDQQEKMKKVLERFSSISLLTLQSHIVDILADRFIDQESKIAGTQGNIS